MNPAPHSSSAHVFEAEGWRAVWLTLDEVKRIANVDQLRRHLRGATSTSAEVARDSHLYHLGGTTATIGRAETMCHPPCSFCTTKVAIAFNVRGTLAEGSCTPDTSQLAVTIAMSGVNVRIR